MRILYHEFYSHLVSFKLKHLLSILLVTGAMLHFTVAVAQSPSQKITGTVLDEKGESVIGASVMIKGTTKGTVTDVSGKFSIVVPDAASILVFRSVGYTQTEKSAGEINGKVITLTSSSSALTEVVIIGYGTAIKRDLTGSVGVAPIAEMQKAPVPSFDQMLAGRIAGVNVTSGDGQPGSSSQITIRGSSVSQDASPLFVIDGIPTENMDINSINPNNIESLEVLKDASSIAIYGARGANGVIIITTKKGTVGAPRINYSYNYGFQQATKKMAMLNAYQYVKSQLDLDSLGNTASTTVLTNHLLYLNPSKGITLDSYKNDPGYNWQDLLLRRGFSQSHNITMNGGTEDTRYSISGGYYNQQGIIINTGLKRFNGSISLDQKVNKNIRVGVSTNYTNTSVYGTQPAAGSGGVVQAMWQYRPTKGVANSDLLTAVIDSATLASFYNGTGSASIGDNLVNPLIQAQNEYRNNINNTGSINVYLEYSFLKDFKLKFSGGYNATSFRSETFYNSQTIQGNLIKNAAGAIPNANGINGNENNGLNQNYLNENTLTYHKAINKYQTLDLLGGITYQYASTFATGFRVINIPQATEYLGIDALNTGTASAPQSYGSRWQLMSYLARANYNIKDRYLFTLTDRYDGSSKFAVGHQWGNFPSAAFAWRFLDEPVLAKAKNYLSDGKLRISYGQVGNNKVGDFSYLSQYGGYTASQGYPLNNVYSGGVTPYFYGNAALTWETTTELDLGLNLGFFNDRISLEADYYDKKTSNFLLGVTIPALGGYPNGANSEYENVGTISNKGIELTLNTVNVKHNKFSWQSSFNIAFNKNKIINFYDGFNVKQTPWNVYGSATAWIAQTGGPISEFYGYVKTGNYQYTDFNKLANGAYVLKTGIAGYTGVQPGDPKYQDINGDGVVDSHDETTLGSPLPIATGGLNNVFSYGNFSLSVFLQFSYGNKILNANKVEFETGNFFSQGNQFADFVNQWSPTNPTDDIPRVIYGNNGLNKGDDGSTNTRPSSWLIEDGSFIRVKTISFAYAIPLKLTTRIGIQSLRVFTSAQNIFTFTKYTGLDPEVSTYRTANPANTPSGTSSGTPVTTTGVGYTYIQPSSGYAALAQGYDLTPYPRAFTLTFGISATF
jgi:TonB-linked SusC/RagA family outer membrane protein